MKVVCIVFWSWLNKSLKSYSSFVCILASTDHSLPNDKILDWSLWKAFADVKIDMTEKLKFVLGKIENIEGKGDNAGYQHFLLFPQFFQKASFSGSLKVGVVWKRVKQPFSRTIFVFFLINFVDLKVISFLIGQIILFSHSEVVYLSIAFKYRKIWRARSKVFPDNQF